jgi:quercetin dioxygenase-like cupin family protein
MVDAMESFNLRQAPAFEPAPGVQMHAIAGAGAMLNLVELAPGAVVPQHSHPHEQIGYVLSGQMTLTVDGVDHALTPEVAYAMPGGVEHGGVAGPEGCVVIDVFQPVREDYREQARRAAEQAG